jgi:tRNA dimethylallyltransferase
MNKLLIICGPTATGKTSLGIYLAKKFNGEILSADSRQVYKGMDIGTGKDLPKAARLQTAGSDLSFYEINGVRVYGYDLVEPKEEFSVSKYLKFASEIIADIESRGKLPILVGGTGLYIKGVVDGIPTADVPRNEELREKLSEKSADELFETLSQIDPLKAGSMNASDRKNPRRLIRAIEISQYLLDHKLSTGRFISASKRDTLFIGLTASKEVIDRRIDERIAKRVQEGIKDEIKGLLDSGVDWNDQSMMSLGYRQYRDFFEGGVEEKLVIDEWAREEKGYAKRQMTWFRKDRRIVWFDISDSNYREKVEKSVKMWYKNKNDQKN